MTDWKQPRLVTLLGYLCLLVGIAVLFWTIFHQALHLI